MFKRHTSFLYVSCMKFLINRFVENLSFKKCFDVKCFPSQNILNEIIFQKKIIFFSENNLWRLAHTKKSQMV
jgi:hypothetical protein